MQDLTTGPVTRHLLKTTSFMLVTMVFQTLYYLVDLYWVGRLGTEAVAAVGVAGNLTFIVLGLSQMLGVGTTAVVSHAVGRKDQGEATMLFNQAQVLAMVTGAVFLVVGLALRTAYSNAVSADAQTAALASDYLAWFIPAMALQFTMVAMGSGLRATGNFKPGMIVGTTTVIINMILAPILIFGWGTGRAFGVAGAAISSLIAIVVGIVWYVWYFVPDTAYLHFRAQHWKPRFAIWKRMLSIGLPTGFEFATTTAYLLIVYAIIRPFGAAAQAAFGIGMRVIQSGFMPVVALGFSVAPVAGQNFGARLPDRVKETFRNAAFLAAGAMLLFLMVCQIAPAALISVFSDDHQVIAIGSEYLRIISWNFVAAGLIFVSSSMFQALGNTIPSLIASSVRITTVAIAIFIVAGMPDFQLAWIWYLSVASSFVQLGVSLWLLNREFGRKLTLVTAPVAIAS